MQQSMRTLGFTLFILIGLIDLIPLNWSNLPFAEAQLGKPDGLYYKSWAIIIGIERYVLAPPIPGAIEDAKQVARAFRKLGFDEVVEIYDKDASSRRLHQVLNEMLPRKVGRMDRLVIFYSGHAGTAQDIEGKDRGYLVPLDAQVNNVAKAVRVEDLKEFTRRSASKHTLLILDAPVFGWEATAPHQLILEGRMTPEAEAERRAVQVISAASKGEVPLRPSEKSLFVRVLLAGLAGEADLNKNGWLMASELGTYLARQVELASNGVQHPTNLRIEGDGDTVLVEGEKAAYEAGFSLQTHAERRHAAKIRYEKAFALLQERKAPAKALGHLNRAIEYDPTLGDAYVLKSYIHLEIVRNLEKALAAGLLATKYAPDNPDSFYTLGLIYEEQGNFAEAEAALQQALRLKADYQDVYFALGMLYGERLHNPSKSVEAFRRYLELGGTHARARAAVAQADNEGRASP